MQNTRIWWITAIALLLIMPAFFAQNVQRLVTTIEDTQVDAIPYTVRGANGGILERGFNIVVQKTSTDVEDPFSSEEERRRQLEAETNRIRQTNQLPTQPFRQSFSTDAETIQNALVQVEYLTSGSSWQRTSCSGGWEVRTVLVSDRTFYARCAIPESTYDKKCVDFRFTAVPQGNPSSYGASQQVKRLCDDEISSISVLGSALKGEFDLTNVSPFNPKYWTYVLFTALLGVLLATLYFSGKSPLSLLDIAQPRLPAPKKGLVAGGQILAPFGYTELKKATKDQNKLLAGLFKAETPLLLAALSATDKSRIDTMVDSMKRNLKWGDRKEFFGAGDVGEVQGFAKGLAALYVKLVPGANVEHIRPLLTKHINAYTEADHTLLARTLNEMENRGSARDRLLLRNLKQFVVGTLQYQQLEALTGHPVNARSWPTQVYQTLLGKTIGGGRFTTLSYVLPAIPDSMVRSAWVGGRMVGAIAGSFIPLRAINRIGARATERTEAARAAGVDLSLFDRIRNRVAVTAQRVASHPFLSSAHPDHLIVGGKAPILNQMADYFVRLEGEAYRDLMRATLTSLYGQYAHLDIETLLARSRYRDLRGLLLVDILHEAGLTPQQINRLSHIDAQVRAIFAEHLPDMTEAQRLHRRLTRLLELAEDHGAHTHDIRTALNGLQNISAGVFTGTMRAHVALLYLEEHISRRQNGTHGGVYAVGREHLTTQEQFETMLFRRMIHDFEYDLHSDQAGLRHGLAGMYLDVANRVVTLGPLAALSGKIPLDPHDPKALRQAQEIADAVFGGVYTGEELIAIQRRTLNYLAEHFLTDEGRRHVAGILRGAKTDEERTAAAAHFGLDEAGSHHEFEAAMFNNLGSLSRLFSGAHELLENRGMTHDAQQAHVDPKTGKVMWWPEGGGEVGADQSYFHLDAKRFWSLGTDERESFAIAQWVNNRFRRGHITAYNADIERELDAEHGTPEEAVNARLGYLARMHIIRNSEEFAHEIEAQNRRRRVALTREEIEAMVEREAQAHLIIDEENGRRRREGLSPLADHEIPAFLAGRLPGHSLMFEHTDLALRARNQTDHTEAENRRRHDEGLPLLTNAELRQNGRVVRNLQLQAEKDVVEARSPQARAAWVRMELERDVINFLNSMNPETYGITHNRVRDLATQVSALLGHAIYSNEVADGTRARGDYGGEVDQYRRYNHSFDRDELVRGLQAHHDTLDAYMRRGVTYGDVSTNRQVWVMLHEGGMVPYVKGMSLSDFDRVLGGYVALRDPATGRWRRFEPNNVEINFMPFDQKQFRNLQHELRELIGDRLSVLTGDQRARYSELSSRGALRAEEQRELDAFNRIMADHIGPERAARFETLRGQLGLQLAWNSLASEPDPHRVHTDILGNTWTWHSFIDAASRWKNDAPHDFQREAIFNGALWRYANQTNDWNRFWDHSNLEIVSKRDTAPFAMGRFWLPRLDNFWARGTIFGVHTGAEHVFRGVRNALLSIGDAISRVSLAAGGSVYDTSYSISPISEHYRLQSWRMAHDILRMRQEEWETILTDVPAGQRGKVRAAYEAVALSHGAYHQVWDFVIDRNPWRQSTSLGAHQAWGSFFHFGPVHPYKIRQNLRALYTGAGHKELSGDDAFSSGFNRFASGAEWALFNMQHGWQMRLARLAIIPYALVSRAFQIAIQGNPSRWDLMESPMKPWNYTAPRIREAFSGISPFTAFERIELPKFVSKYNLVPSFFKHIPLLRRITNESIDISEPWGSSLVRTHTGGRDFGKGLSVSPQDLSFVRTGVFAVARTGEANPGVSYYDYRQTLQLDPAAAQFLAYRSNATSAYFREESYVRRQAHVGTIKREVAAEAKAIRSEEEQRTFGVFGNPVFSVFNPFMLIWHGPPGLPMISLKEGLTWFNNRRKTEERTNLVDPLKNFWRKVAPVPLTFHKSEDEHGQTHMHWGMEWKAGIFPGTMWRPFRDVYAVSCAACGTGGYMGTVCKRCKRVIYAASGYKNTGLNNPARWGKAASAWNSWGVEQR